MDIIQYLPELISVAIIAAFMVISPGADFVMITRNSLFHEKASSLRRCFFVFAFACWSLMS